MKKPAELFLSSDPDANTLIADDPLALLIGLVLHQQVATEKAFVGPLHLKQRLGEDLDAATIAAMDPERLVMVFKEKPALHRFPGSMAGRVQGVCDHVASEYGGDVAAIWTDIASADELMDRLRAIPGFGDYKARIYLGVLAQRFGIRPSDYEEHLPTWPSIVDVETPDDLIALKERKKAWKAAQK